MKKKPIAVIVTDTHLKTDNIEDNLRLYDAARELCIRYNVSMFHGGDVFTSRKAQSLDVLTTFSSILENNRTSNIHMYAIPGNHDKVSYQDEQSYLDPFEHTPNFTVFKNYGFVDTSSVRIHMIPFFDEKTVYSDYLKLTYNNICAKRKNVLITHIAINGVQNNDRSFIENTMTHDLFNEHFDLVIIGHYHNAQQVDIFNYIGSSFPHNFGEDNNKGICLLYDDLSLEIIDYHFKRYINYVVDPHLVNDALIAEITNESVIHNVKLTINGTKDQTTEINRYISQLSKICATSVVTDEGNTVIENITTNNLLTTFEQYCALNDFDFKTIAPYIINKIKNYTDNE